jgi:hypothetical protein
MRLRWKDKTSVRCIYGTGPRTDIASDRASRQSHRRMLGCVCPSFTHLAAVCPLLEIFPRMRRSTPEALDLVSTDEHTELQPFVFDPKDLCTDAKAIYDRVLSPTQRRLAAGQHNQQSLGTLDGEDCQPQFPVRESPHRDKLTFGLPCSISKSVGTSFSLSLDPAESTGQIPVAIPPGSLQYAHSPSFAAALYASDYRNMNHSLVPPNECFHSHCHIHYSDKIMMGWFPKDQDQIRSKCDGPWFRCFLDTCEAHLWDKRARRYFPGRIDPAELLRMRALLKGECEQGRWETCLQDDCSAHFTDKQRNGFLETK